MKKDFFRDNITAFVSQLSLRGFHEVYLSALRNSRPDHLAIIGIGGSGLSGGILETVKDELGLNLPITIWKNYGLPHLSSSKRPLYVFVSFSGNSKETLSGLTRLLRNRASRSRIAVVTSGGELLRLAERDRLPCVTFPAGTLTPRQAIGRMFHGIVKVLLAANLRIRLPKTPRINTSSLQGAGRRLAQLLKHRLIVIYTANSNYILGYIWKIKLNETAKTLAFVNVLPEADHNELVAFDHPQRRTAAIFLTERHMNPHLKKQIRVTQALLESRRVAVHELVLSGKNKLEKIWRSVVLADWTSYFLAKFHGLDPQETKIITELKTLMT